MPFDAEDENVVKAVKVRVGNDLEKVSEPLRPVLLYIRDHLFEDDFQISQIEKRIDINHSFRKEFQAELGTGPKAYVMELKLDAACYLLSDTHYPVWKIAQVTGFKRSRYFSQVFKAKFGKTPQQFREVSQKRVVGENPDCFDFEFILKAPAKALMPDEARRLVARLRCDSSPPETFPGDSDLRRLAKAIWKALETEPVEHKSALICQPGFFSSSALFHLLSKASLEQGRISRQQGIELAELALTFLEVNPKISGEPIADLTALGWARLANARRLALDYPGAEQAFEEVDLAWKDSTARGPKAEAEALFLKAVFFHFQRKTDQSRQLLHRALALSRVAGDRQLLIKCLLQSSKINDSVGNHKAAICEGQEALELLGNPVDSTGQYLKYVAYGNLVASFLWAKRPGKALEALSKTVRCSQSLHDPLGSLQLLWLEGVCRIELADLAKGEELLNRAYRGLIEIDESGYAAVVLLELATLYSGQARWEEAARAAREAIPILQFLDLPETFGAIKILDDAVSANYVTRAILQEAKDILLQLCRDPSLPLVQARSGSGRKNPP